MDVSYLIIIVVVFQIMDADAMKYFMLGVNEVRRDRHLSDPPTEYGPPTPYCLVCAVYGLPLPPGSLSEKVHETPINAFDSSKMTHQERREKIEDLKLQYVMNEKIQDCLKHHQQVCRCQMKTGDN